MILLTLVVFTHGILLTNMVYCSIPLQLYSAKRVLLDLFIEQAITATRRNVFTKYKNIFCGEG